MRETPARLHAQAVTALKEAVRLLHEVEAAIRSGRIREAIELEQRSAAKQLESKKLLQELRRLS